MTKWNKHIAIKLRRAAIEKARLEREADMNAFAAWVMGAAQPDGHEEQERRERAN